MKTELSLSVIQDNPDYSKRQELYVNLKLFKEIKDEDYSAAREAISLLEKIARKYITGEKNEGKN